MGSEQNWVTPRGEKLIHEIVTSVAEARGVDPTTLEERLHDVVDPDALWQLSADRSDGTPRRGGQVTFTLAGCDVTVDGERNVSVSAADVLTD